MRCFISIDLPKEVQKELSSVQKKIEDKDVKMNLVSPEIIHLTIKFLGELTDLQVERVISFLKELKFKRFNAKFERVGVFPSPDFVKVVWIGMGPRNEFVKIHDKVDSSLSKMKFTKDKTFENHATLARVKWVKDKTKYFEKLNKIEVNPIKFTVDKIHLKKSTLTEKGPIYEDLFVLRFE